jgi:hypothetical protein
MFSSYGRAKIIAIVCVGALALGAGAFGVHQWLSASEEETPPRGAPQNPGVAQVNPADVEEPGAEATNETRPGITGKGHNQPPDLLQVAMQRLHHEAVQRFLSSPENGVRRLVILPKKIESEWNAPFWSPGEVTQQATAENKGDLARIHEQSLGDFLSPKLIIDPKAPIANPRGAVLLKDLLDRKKHKDWEIKSLDLVGLVKYDHPVVYVSEKLPDMKKLKGVPTRLLDFFELAAVEELKKGEDLFIASKDGTVRLLGAIRATRDCLECHSGKERDLLGAFSYTLRAAQYVEPNRPAKSSRPKG